MNPSHLAGLLLHVSWPRCLWQPVASRNCLGRLRHARIAGRGTQAFARLENAGLHRVPNGLCWDLGGCSLLEWWGGGDCVVRDVLFMGPLRQMRRVAGRTHVARTDCTPYYASALTNQRLPSRKRQFRRANPARCSGGFQRATTPRNSKTGVSGLTRMRWHDRDKLPRALFAGLVLCALSMGWRGTRSFCVCRVRANGRPIGHQEPSSCARRAAGNLTTGASKSGVQNCQAETRARGNAEP